MGSAALEGQSRLETGFHELPRCFLAHGDGPKAHVGLQAGLGMVLAIGRICPSLLELLLCCWR